MTLNRRQSLLALSGASAMTGLGLAPAVTAQTPPSPFVGSFLGTLVAGAVKLRLRLVIVADQPAMLYSIDQGNAAIPASKTELSATTIALEFASIGAKYSGVLKDNDHIEGTFTQGAPLPLNLTRGDSFAAGPADGPLTEETLKALRTEDGSPGMAAAWNRKGMTTTVLADGLRAADSAAAVTAQDRWHLGSLTKSMTATLAGRCVEAGLITWQTTIGDILATKVPDMNPAYRDVSLLHLLSHMAGLQANIDLAELAKFSRTPLADPRPERLAYATQALKQTPAAAPATQMIYSNNGYVIAGAMLEAVTGQSWESLITAQVFAPLGLSSAGFGPPGVEGKTDQPMGHAVGPDGRRTPLWQDNPFALGPAGRVHMSLSDLINYLAAHRDMPASLLSAPTWKTLHTPPFSGNYALGWFVSPDGALWHNGSNTLWYAEVLVDSASGVVAATAANDAVAAAGSPGRILRAAHRAALMG